MSESSSKKYTEVSNRQYAKGVEKYGKTLTTDPSGRDPFEDVAEELVDATQYLVQLKLTGLTGSQYGFLFETTRLLTQLLDCVPQLDLEGPVCGEPSKEEGPSHPFPPKSLGESLDKEGLLDLPEFFLRVPPPRPKILKEKLDTPQEMG
jgi:hypothetical protein